MERKSFFSYSWHLEEQKYNTSIRVYGIDENNNNICIRIDNFTPYVYIELPNYINWDIGKVQMIGNKIDELVCICNDKIGKCKCDRKPVKKMLMMKKKLYGAHFEQNGKRKLFPFLFCSFRNRKYLRNLEFKLEKPLNILTIGRLKLKVHESQANDILQLTCCKNIPTSGWTVFHGTLQPEMEKVTLCDYEYKVKWKNLYPDNNNNNVVMPLVMGFDIEVNSTNPSRMPQSNIAGDEIFQISCVLSRYGEKDKNKQYKKYLLTLGEPNQEILGNDIVVYKYKTEYSLLNGFTQFIREQNPNIITGYNILGFDIPYMIDRSKFRGCFSDFSKQGFHKFLKANEKTIKWSSSAYGTQEFQFLDAEGRLYVDLLPLVKRDFKFNNYKLKTVSEYFIGKTKDDLSVEGIFKCYRVGTKQNKNGKYTDAAKKAIAVCGKYCVQDSHLVVLLTEKLQTWIGLTEMAKTCQVPIFTLYTQGQQIKVFSQVYKYCMYKNIVVEKDGYKTADDERYTGAHVFPPVPGRYKKVVPFDFASLYPTTIIAYNIDYHTWVPDNSNIPDSKCHVMEWEDHISCSHDPKVIRKLELSKYIENEQSKLTKLREKRDKTSDKLYRKEFVNKINKLSEELKPYIKERSEITKTISKSPMCAKRKYRFLKEPKGVLPTIIQNLLDARKHTRKVDIVNCKNKIKELENSNEDHYDEITNLKSMIDVLNKRQLAYKVSANSMYGAMGVKKGYFPFMPGAMCTTYMGRVNIEKVAKLIPSKYGGKLIYGDTDSNYITFPHIKTAQELWDYSLKVANEVSQIFPSPIKLEFEEEIYDFFFILSKKRYMYRKCLRDGVVDKKIGKKGVLLARRDNSKFVRDVYESVINQIADNVSRDDILYSIINELNQMFSLYKPYTDFIITKSVGDYGHLKYENSDEEYTIITNEKGVKQVKLGDYVVPLLPTDETERAKQLLNKKATNEKDYYIKCLPSQVQLANKMCKRGKRVDIGTRLEYIVIDPDNHNDKQYNKIESTEYYNKHSDIIKIDYYYYLKALVNPLDQVLNVAFGKDANWKSDFVLEQYKFRLKCRHKVLSELKQLFSPKLTFI